MIRLKDILKEIDLGKVPFADPEAVDDPDAYGAYLKKWNYVEEPNTEDEQAFVNDLQSYIEEPNIHTSQAAHMATVLKQLLPLKSKFPGILDPSKSAKFVYRGTTIPIKSFINSPASLEGDDLTFNVKTKLNAKGDRNFLSFSTDQYTAENFVDMAIDADENENEIVKKGLVPAMIVLSAANPNLIFNPEAIDFYSMYTGGASEDETFHVGTTLTTDKIILSSSAAKWIQNLTDIPAEYQEAFAKLKSLYS